VNIVLPTVGVGEIDNDPTWYRRAVIYQTHVRAFYDSNGDGIGDFRGLSEKLDYIQDLGVTALWLLPFYPSPLRDGGYDISDYTGIHPAYGTMRDFRQFVRAAHERGIRVITELVLNHTSDAHGWFQRARTAATGSRLRDYYVWSDSPEPYPDARIIFKDFETSNWAWDPLAKAYYWHRFYSHQPDLNWRNPAVERELVKVMDFWLDAGVDGLRLDAVPYLFEREGTNCENLPETHDALQRLRRHVDSRYAGRMLLAEANQWPEDAVAYFGRGDECHMCFHFPLMPRLYMAMETEDRFPLVDIMQQTPDLPAGCQWAVFLRNHDELTLEMVTDEERDHMYRVYASNQRARINLGIRRRLAPLLNNDRRKIELLNGLLFSLNGTPIVYYGDEIGMGDNIYLGDRDGVRTPMQWNADRNAGFSGADPQQLYLPVNIDPEYRYEAVNVEAQQRNPNSLFWWMKRLIALRRRYGVLGEGSLEFLYPSNGKILAFVRQDGDQRMLVVANLSRSVQYAELDLSAYQHAVPREVFGRARFPRIGRQPYMLTLGPYAFYWLDLAERTAPALSTRTSLPPEITSRASFASIASGRSRAQLERALPEILASQRWFGGKARAIAGVEIVDSLSPPEDNGELAPQLLLARVDYEEGQPEVYILPIASVHGVAAGRGMGEEGWTELARLTRAGAPEDDGWLIDALDLPSVRRRLLSAVIDKKPWRGRRGVLRGRRTHAWRAIAEALESNTGSVVVRADHSNSALRFEDRLVMKIVRRAENGVNPDLEIGAYLTEGRSFAAFPEVVGALEYHERGAEPVTVAIVQRFIPNHGDAWAFTLSELGRFLERTLTEGRPSIGWDHPRDPLELESAAPTLEAQARIGEYWVLAAALGERTAELHRALGAPTGKPEFAPEPFSTHYQRGLYQSMRTLTARNLAILREHVADLPPSLQTVAEQLLEDPNAILSSFQRVTARLLSGKRIRCHGDYHLGQVLFTGRDWVIIDFEGEPARPIGERRIKRSPLRDVAGMLRSFHYAMHRALDGQVARGSVQPGSDTFRALFGAAGYWLHWVSAVFLQSYLRAMDTSDLLPKTPDERRILLEVCMLEKAIYELGYELNNRPHLVGIPLDGISRLAGHGSRHSLLPPGPASRPGGKTRGSGSES
jgi:maltose alpha-D-glucosyltransferase/alpha-amylase